MVTLNFSHVTGKHFRQLCFTSFIPTISYTPAPEVFILIHFCLDYDFDFFWFSEHLVHLNISVFLS